MKWNEVPPNKWNEAFEAAKQTPLRKEMKSLQVVLEDGFRCSPLCQPVGWQVPRARIHQKGTFDKQDRFSIAILKMMEMGLLLKYSILNILDS